MVVPRFSSTCIILSLLLITIAAEKCTFFTQRVQCGALTCNVSSGECVECRTHDECNEAALQCVEGKCEIKPFVDHFSYKIVIAAAGAIVVCSVAVVAGVGGGGILVPMYIGLLDVPITTAVALSQATIAGQSMFNTFLLSRRHHPDFPPPASRPVINYEYLSLILPISLVGTLLGSAASKVVADWMRVVLLYAVLTNVLVRVVKRFKAKMKEDLAKTSDATDETALKDMEVDDAAQPVAVGSIQSEDEGPVSPQFPRFEIGLGLMSFVMLFVVNIVRSLYTTCGSWEQLIAYVFPICVLVGAYFIARWNLTTQWNRVKEGSALVEHFPFQWNWKNVTLLPIVAVTAGGAASMLGIGGGLVLSFLLLEVGLVPEEASSTGGLATFLVASESGLQYAIQGQLPADFAALFLSCGAVSTAIGQFIFVKEIKRRQWNFLIILCLGIIIGGSMLALTIYGVYNTAVIVQHHGYLGFGDFCKEIR